MNMVQSHPHPPKVLDQARRRRVIKAPDERRREILEAATDLFRERGFEPTTVQAVAAAAGVAAGTVYLYFPSKEAILTAMQEEFETGLIDRFAEISEAVLAEEAESGEDVTYEEVVSRLIDGMVDFSLERRALAEVIVRDIRRVAVTPDSPLLRGTLTELLTRVIREGVRLGHIETTDPEMSAYLLNVASATAIGQAIAFEDEAMLRRVVDAAKELYIKALAPGHRGPNSDWNR
jgi:AcrR family transcriptional regulator